MTFLNRAAATAASILLVSTIGALGAPASAVAADNAWIGSWKLDPAKSNFTGDTFTYSKSANGQYRFSDGSTVSYDFGIDSKEYPSAYNRTTTWTATGERGWDSITKANGIVLARVHRELSPDDKNLTITATGTNPDGSFFNESTVYQRVSGTTGLVGKWRSIKSNAGSPEKFVITSPAPGVLHWEIPDLKATTESRLDGADNPITGPNQPPGMTLSAKSESPSKLAYVIKVNGKPDLYGIDTLAADGLSYTDVSWSPGKESEKSTGLYVKQ
jgi:hypothetical protein